MPEERDNLLLVPAWHEDKQDHILTKLVQILLARDFIGSNGEVDVRGGQLRQISRELNEYYRKSHVGTLPNYLMKLTKGYLHTLVLIATHDKQALPLPLLTPADSF